MVLVSDMKLTPLEAMGRDLGFCRMTETQRKDFA
jgi:hypothetical protein